MEKIKLNAKETRNLTRVKINDVKQLIKDAQFLLDAFYYDKQIAYMPGVRPNAMTNPVQGVYNLIQSIEFMLDKYSKGEWERENELDGNENRELYDVIFGLRQALHNAVEYAMDNSQFKDKYKNWWNAYFINNEEALVFRNAEEKLKNKIKEEAGWAPTYSSGHAFYSYWIGYKGQMVSLDEIERDDGKEILNAKMVQDRIDRGY